MLNKKWVRRAFNFKHIITIIAAGLFSAAAMFLFSGNIRSRVDSNKFLKNRNYNYSILVDKEINQDSYSYYDDKLSFYTNNDLKLSLPASVLMRLECDYTSNDILFGEVDYLESNEIVITQNLAREYKISAGDSLYSKNKINNGIDKYSVKEIIPDLYSVIGVSDNIESGLIIKGFDSNSYAEITSDFVFFYEEDYSYINNSGASIIGNSLTAKNDQIKKTNSKLAFELITTSMLCLSIQLIAGFVLYVFNKKYYFICKEYGVTDTFKKQPADFAIYESMILIISLMSYSLISLFTAFTFIQYVCILAPIVISYFFIFFVSKKAIERR